MSKETRFDKKRAKTKAKLFNAAMELFLAQGYEDTTIEQIVERADVAKGTFFIHFPSKSAVLFYLGEQRVALIEEMLTKELRDIKSAREKIFCLLSVLAQVNEDDREITALITGEIFKISEMDPEKENQRQLKTVLLKIFEQGQRQGEFRHDFGPEHAADLILSVYFYTLLQWLGGGLNESLAEGLQARVKIIMGGIDIIR